MPGRLRVAHLYQFAQNHEPSIASSSCSEVVLLSYLNHYPSLDELRQTIDEKGARVVVVRYNHGSVIEWLQQNATIGAHLGLKPPFAWGCLNRFLIT
jgi:hypothetical protein